MLRITDTGMGLSIERIFILLFKICIHLKYQMFKVILNPQALLTYFF